MEATKYLTKQDLIELRLQRHPVTPRDSDLFIDIRRMDTGKLRHCLALCRKYTAIELGKDHPNLDFINRWRKSIVDYTRELARREPSEALQCVS